MAFAQLDSIRIHYEVVGDASFPTLVLSNSLGVNLSMWEPQMSALAAHFCVLRYDVRGHGNSSISQGPYAIADLGRDVLRLLDLLRIEKASFCGISMGGVTGQWLALNQPKRIDKLVLASTAAKIGSEETWNARIATVLKDGLGSVVPGTLERWFSPGFRASNPEVIAATGAMLSATSPAGYAACCAAIRDADFRAMLSAITAPTLVLSGSNDPVTPPSDGQFLASLIPGARYVELPAAHLASVEAASAFNAALLGFLLR